MEKIVFHKVLDGDTGEYASREVVESARAAQAKEFNERIELLTKERDHIQLKLERCQSGLKEALACWGEFQKLATERGEALKEFNGRVEALALAWETQADDLIGDPWTKASLKKCAAEIRKLKVGEKAAEETHDE